MFFNLIPVVIMSKIVYLQGLDLWCLEVHFVLEHVVRGCNILLLCMWRLWSWCIWFSKIKFMLILVNLWPSMLYALIVILYIFAGNLLQVKVHRSLLSCAWVSCCSTVSWQTSLDPWNFILSSRSMNREYWVSSL